MQQRIHEYPEVVGKTAAKMTVTNQSDWRNITVKFTDNTAIHFGIRPVIQIGAGARGLDDRERENSAELSLRSREETVMRPKTVICAQVMIDVIGPADASRERIRFVIDILRGCIRTLDKDFRMSRIPQMKGFSLKPGSLARRKDKYGK